MYFYRIDNLDRISYVSRDWLRFAVENGAPELTRSAVVGQSIWDFVAEFSCSAVYRSLFATVRESKSSVTIPFRCDSPTLKRFMELYITPLPKARLQLCGRLIGQEARPYRAVLDPVAKRNAEWVYICAWCRRVESPKKCWVEIDTAVRRFGWFSGDTVPNVSHGICPRCARQFAKIPPRQK